MPLPLLSDEPVSVVFFFFLVWPDPPTAESSSFVELWLEGLRTLPVSEDPVELLPVP